MALACACAQNSVVPRKTCVQESAAVSEVPFDLGMHVGSEVSLTKVNQSSPEQLRGPGKPRADLYICY